MFIILQFDQDGDGDDDVDDNYITLAGILSTLVGHLYCHYVDLYIYMEKNQGMFQKRFSSLSGRSQPDGSSSGCTFTSTSL